MNLHFSLRSAARDDDDDNIREGLFDEVNGEVHNACDQILESGHANSQQLRVIDAWQKHCSANGIVDKSLIRKMGRIGRRGLIDDVVVDDEVD